MMSLYHPEISLDALHSAALRSATMNAINVSNPLTGKSYHHNKYPHKYQFHQSKHTFYTYHARHWASGLPARTPVLLFQFITIFFLYCASYQVFFFNFLFFSLRSVWQTHQ